MNRNDHGITASTVYYVNFFNGIFDMPAGIEMAWRTLGMKRAANKTPVPYL